MGRFFAIITFVFCSLALQAQVFSPDLECVRNDTLYWQIPVNLCGTFNSYDIYFSTDADAPFTLLSELTTESQTSYYHSNTGGAFYYYMAGNYDCPNETVILSDTLDNLQSPVAVISSASVEGGEVELTWQISDTPEVIGYIIFRETNVGVVPIDTVYGDISFYLDLNATADMNAESYYVLALDACGGTSLFDAEHRTIFLETSTEDCDDFIHLNWTPYIGWPAGVEAYEIWLSTNGDAEILVAEFNGDTTAYDFPEPTDFNEYCFYLVAREAAGNNTVKSNISCETVDIIQPIRRFGIKNVSVREDKSVIVDWVWRSSAELTDYTLGVGTDVDNLTAVFTEEIMPPLPFENTYLDTDSDPSLGNVYYSVGTVDGCGKSANSNVSSTIFVEGKAIEGDANLISWTPLMIDNSIVDSYEIFLLENGVSTSVGLVNGNENEYLYQDVVLRADQPFKCYYVVANARVTLFDESEQFILSRSNQVCVQQNSRIFAPNAFAPEGINREFRAVVLYEDMVRFEMQVYDRFGQQIFVSSDVNEGWDGKIKGQKAPQGVYVYHVSITQENGRKVDKQGTVLLLN